MNGDGNEGNSNTQAEGNAEASDPLQAIAGMIGSLSSADRQRLAAMLVEPPGGE